MIKKINNLWYVYSEDGTNLLSKGYKTKNSAIKRLKEIEHYKERSGEIWKGIIRNED